MVIDAGSDPDCVNSGWTEGSHCSVCQEFIKEPFELLALGHTFALGSENHICLVCGGTSPFRIETEDLPIVWKNTFRIENITYTVRRTIDYWQFKLQITYTNLTSQTTTTAPSVMLKNTNREGVLDPEPLLPGETGILVQYYYVAYYITGGTYALVYE